MFLNKRRNVLYFLYSANHGHIHRVKHAWGDFYSGYLRRRIFTHWNHRICIYYGDATKWGGMERSLRKEGSNWEEVPEGWVGWG